MNEPILIDESFLDEEFIPERLVCREGQIKEIARCLSPARNGKSIRSIFLFGKPGVGKTLVCKWLLKEHFLKQSVYVNCWSNRTTHKVMESILSQMGQVLHGRESTSDLVKRFQSLHRKVIVCLDESDHLRDTDILYILARNACGIILISNQLSRTSEMDARIKSSLLLNEIEFKPYSKDEILSILKARTIYAIRPDSIDFNLLSLIAKMCNGDARIGLQTLKNAAKEAESKDANKITFEDIKFALKCSRKYKLSYLIGKLNEDQRAVYEILKRNPAMPSGELYRTYCKHVSSPVTDRGYRNNLERMIEIGLVKVEGTGRWKVCELAIT